MTTPSTRQEPDFPMEATRKISGEIVATIGSTTLEHATYELPGGRTKTIAVTHRPDAVAVLPLRRTLDGQIEVLLVDQPRPAVDHPAMTEAVAGKMDPGEVDPFITAARELAEEAGYAAHHWHLLQSNVAVSPGYTTERIHLLVCWQLITVPSREEDAHITGRWLTLTAALDQIDRGLITDMKTIAALTLTERRITQNIIQLPDPAPEHEDHTLDDATYADHLAEVSEVAWERS